MFRLFIILYICATSISSSAEVKARIPVKFLNVIALIETRNNAKQCGSGRVSVFNLNQKIYQEAVQHNAECSNAFNLAGVSFAGCNNYWNAKNVLEAYMHKHVGNNYSPASLLYAYLKGNHSELMNNPNGYIMLFNYEYSYYGSRFLLKPY